MDSCIFSHRTLIFCTSVQLMMKIWLFQKAKISVMNKEKSLKPASHGEVIALYFKSTIRSMVASSASHVIFNKAWKWRRGLLVLMTIQYFLCRKSQSATFKGRYVSCPVEAWSPVFKRDHWIKNKMNFQMKLHFGRRMDWDTVNLCFQIKVWL